MRRRALAIPSIIEFTTDPQMLGLSLSPAQETVLRAIYGLPLTDDQLELYRGCTGRSTYSGRPFGEVTVVAGARSGKDSRVVAPIVCYEAVFGGHDQHVARGEQAVIPLVAQDQRATRIAFGYIRSYLTNSALLAPLVQEVLASEIVLTNGVKIVCFPSTLSAIRGWSIPVGVMDEVAFFRVEGQADADVEIQTSIRRGMIAFPSTRLVKISTPYMKGGVLFEDFTRAFGQDDPDLLVWRASTQLMHPAIPSQRLDRERRLDPRRFAREFEAEFAEDVDAFLPAAWVDGAVEWGRHERPPHDARQYVAAIDPFGGGPDAFTLVIVHTEGSDPARLVVQDVMKGWERPRTGTVDLQGIVEQICTIVKQYRVTSVIGDRYAGQWVQQAFEARGLHYEEAPDKAQAYLDVLPLFAQGRVQLLDDARLVRELKALERRPRHGGRDVVDHPRGGHDDYANALALAAAKTLRMRADSPWAVPSIVHVDGLDSYFRDLG